MSMIWNLATPADGVFPNYPFVLGNFEVRSNHGDRIYACLGGAQELERLVRAGFQVSRDRKDLGSGVAVMQYTSESNGEGHLYAYKVDLEKKLGAKVDQYVNRQLGEGNPAPSVLMVD